MSGRPVPLASVILLLERGRIVSHVVPPRRARTLCGEPWPRDVTKISDGRVSCPVCLAALLTTQAPRLPAEIEAPTPARCDCPSPVAGAAVGKCGRTFALCAGCLMDLPSTARRWIPGGAA